MSTDSAPSPTRERVCATSLSACRKQLAQSNVSSRRMMHEPATPPAPVDPIAAGLGQVEARLSSADGFSSTAAASARAPASPASALAPPFARTARWPLVLLPSWGSSTVSAAFVIVHEMRGGVSE